MMLEQMTFAELLTLYNSISDKKAGPKTFASRARIIERIKNVAEIQGMSLDALMLRLPRETTLGAEAGTASTESDGASPEKSKKRGNGVGELACRLLLDPEGFPYALIATMVNAEILGSATTDKSIRWYASKMRKAGIDVPARQAIRDNHIWITDPEAAKEWLRSVRVVEPGLKE